MAFMPKLVRAIGEFFLDTIETVVIAMSIFLVIYLFFMQPHQVNGQSMVPTFQSGEYLLTDKVSYRLGDPQRGDVVVFHAPKEAGCPEGTGCDYIKRIIATPGETISLKNSTYYINGTPLKEDYIPAEYETLPGLFLKQHPEYTLQANEYFVSGDNRPYSSDSRAWGPITKSEIVGRGFVRYWPPKVAGFIQKVSY